MRLPGRGRPRISCCRRSARGGVVGRKSGSLPDHRGSRARKARPAGRPRAGSRRGSRRIAAAIATAMPTPISTSPMLKTFASGSQAGVANTSVSGSSAGRGTIAARGARTDARPDRREGACTGRHRATVGQDRGQVAGGTEDDERDAGQAEVGDDDEEHQARRSDVDPPAPCPAPGRRPTARTGRAGRRGQGAARGARRNRTAASPSSRPPSSQPATSPTGIAYRMNTAEVSVRPPDLAPQDHLLPSALHQPASRASRPAMTRTPHDRREDLGRPRRQPGRRAHRPSSRSISTSSTRSPRPRPSAGCAPAASTVRHPERTVATADHSIPTHPRSLPMADPMAAAQVDQLTRNCARVRHPAPRHGRSRARGSSTSSGRSSG